MAIPSGNTITRELSSSTVEGLNQALAAAFEDNIGYDGAGNLLREGGTSQQSTIDFKWRGTQQETKQGINIPIDKAYALAFTGNGSVAKVQTATITGAIEQHSSQSRLELSLGGITAHREIRKSRPDNAFLAAVIVKLIGEGHWNSLIQSVNVSGATITVHFYHSAGDISFPTSLKMYNSTVSILVRTLAVTVATPTAFSNGSSGATLSASITRNDALISKEGVKFNFTSNQEVIFNHAQLNDENGDNALGIFKTLGNQPRSDYFKYNSTTGVWDDAAGTSVIPEAGRPCLRANNDFGAIFQGQEDAAAVNDLAILLNFVSSRVVSEDLIFTSDGSAGMTLLSAGATDVSGYIFLNFGVTWVNTKESVAPVSAAALTIHNNVNSLTVAEKGSLTGTQVVILIEQLMVLQGGITQSPYWGPAGLGYILDSGYALSALNIELTFVRDGITTIVDLGALFTGERTTAYQVSIPESYGTFTIGITDPSDSNVYSVPVTIAQDEAITDIEAKIKTAINTAKTISGESLSTFVKASLGTVTDGTDSASRAVHEFTLTLDWTDIGEADTPTVNKSQMNDIGSDFDDITDVVDGTEPGVTDRIPWSTFNFNSTLQPGGQTIHYANLTYTKT